jgi:hypothetical protein
MTNKQRYKDLKKYAEAKRRYQRGYRERTGAYIYRPRGWTCIEDELVLKKEMTDRELSFKIHRSVGAIQKRRFNLTRNDDN